MSLFNTGCFRFYQQLDPSRLFQNLTGDAIYSCTPPTFTSTLNLTRCLYDKFCKVQTLYRVITDELGLVQVELFIPAVSGLDSPPLPESECLLFQPELRRLLEVRPAHIGKQAYLAPDAGLLTRRVTSYLPGCRRLLPRYELTSIEQVHYFLHVRKFDAEFK